MQTNTNTNLPTYVFTTVNSGRVAKVVEELKQNSQIDFIAPVTGRYDLVLRLKQSSPTQVYQTIQQIREVADVRTTDAHTAFDGIQPNRKPESQMAFGISLLNVQHQSIESTIKQLSNVPGLVEAYSVPGQFDIVALWQARTTDDLVKTTFERFPQMQGIFRSETLLARTPFFRF